MAINFNNQNQGIGTLDLSQFGLMQPQNQNMQVADAYNTPTEGEYGFNLIELDKLKNAGYDPAELSTYPNQEDVQSIIRNLEPTANANNIMTDANVGTPSSIIEDEQGNLIDTENRVQFGNENFDSEPYQYTPNYLGANSPMLNDEGNATLSSVTNYGYDPAFGQLQNHFYGDTSYPGSGDTTGYFDDYLQTQQVPSLQRALGNPRFALAPELTSQPQELGYVEPATVPKEAIYQDRIMNRNLSNSNYEPKQGILQGLQSKIGAGFNNVKDFAIDKGRMGKNLIGAGAAKFAGLPGMVGSGLMSLLSNLGNGVDYQQYTPGFDYNGLNDSMINDFYDPATGLNRFDRARRKGNTFASARTGAEYFKLRREKKAVEAAAEAKRQSDLQTVQQRAARGDSYSDIGRDMYTGQGQAFAKQSGGSSGKKGTSTERNYGGRKDGGRIGYNQGGLASMFTRRR